MNKRNLIISICGLLIIIIIGALTYLIINNDKNIAYQTITAKRANISKEIKASGQIKPAEELEMSWEKSGRVSRVNIKVGDKVKAGDVLMSMDSSDLSAQLSQAQANLLSAQAMLDQLKNGARPEEIELKRIALEKSQQDLASSYDNAFNTLSDAYAKADEAVRKNTDDFFNQDNTYTPTLTFITNNSQLEINIQSQRLIVENDLNNWQKEMSSIASNKNPEAITSEISKVKAYLDNIRIYLNQAVEAANSAVNLSVANSLAYKNNATLGRTYVNGAISTVNAQEQIIKTQRIAVDSAQKMLDLQKAGARSEDVAAQVARVAQAQAAVDLINVQIAKTILRAPIDGTITKAEAKVGEIAMPNIPAVALISDGKLEIEIRLPETDIAAIKSGDIANIKTDAFGDKSYSATVITIDPAESVATDGSSGYKVRLQFNETYEELKSGMTANVSIPTAQKNNVVTLPNSILIRKQNNYFIITSDRQEKPVQIGLTGNDGQTEIISGINEGETVLSIGR